MTLREDREGLGVQVHVVDDGAVDVEDDTAGEKLSGTLQIIAEGGRRGRA